MGQEFSLVNSIVCIYPTITGIFCDVTHKYSLLHFHVSFHTMTEADYEQVHRECFDDSNFVEDYVYRNLLFFRLLLFLTINA